MANRECSATWGGTYSLGLAAIIGTLGLHKSFNTPWFGGERGTLQFRFETYNTFNHPQWDSVNAYCGGNTPAGTPCSGTANNFGNGEVNGTWNPRNVANGLEVPFLIHLLSHQPVASIGRGKDTGPAQGKRSSAILM